VLPFSYITSDEAVFTSPFMKPQMIKGPAVV